MAIKLSETRGKLREMIEAKLNPAALPEPPKNGKRTRQVTKAESEFREVLRLWLREQRITQWHEQAMTMRFEDGTRYTPDFMAITPDGRLLLIEVKGGYRGPGWEQGYERYRRARDVFGGEKIMVIMATKNDGKWSVDNDAF